MRGKKNMAFLVSAADIAKSDPSELLGSAIEVSGDQLYAEG